MAQMSEKQVLLTVGIVGVVLSGAAFGGVYWAKGRIEEEKASIQNLDGQIKQAEAKKVKIPQDENKLIILRENVAEYVKILPETKDLTDFTRTVNSFTQNAGVNLRSLTPANIRGNPKSAFRQYQYNLAFTGTLWQFLRFVNLFESYKRFVNVTGFKLTAGKPAEGETIDDIVHQFSMSVVTYTYNRAANGKPVEIKQYEKKKSRLREEIYRARQNIRIERYDYRGRRERRDIFVDPRVDPGSDSSITISKQRETLEKLAQQVVAASKLNERRIKEPVLLLRFEKRRELKGALDKIGTELARIEERDIITYHPFKLRLQREVREPLAAMRQQLDGSNKGERKGLSIEQLTAIRRQMEDALDQGQLTEATDRYELVSEQVKFPASDDRSVIAAELAELYRKAKIALRFTSMELAVSGIIVTGDGLSTAIINGKTYTEGDAISDQLFLKEVAEEYTEFVFQGVVLRRKR